MTNDNAGARARLADGGSCLGLAGTFIELLLLAHYEEVWQVSPLVLIALAIGGMAWHYARPRAASVRALRLLMMLFVVSGIAGTALHMRGAAEFQLEIDPSLPRWALFKKVMQGAGAAGARARRYDAAWLRRAGCALSPSHSQRT